MSPFSAALVGLAALLVVGASGFAHNPQNMGAGGSTRVEVAPWMQHEMERMGEEVERAQNGEQQAHAEVKRAQGELEKEQALGQARLFQLAACRTPKIEEVSLHELLAPAGPTGGKLLGGIQKEQAGKIIVEQKAQLTLSTNAREAESLLGEGLASRIEAKLQGFQLSPQAKAAVLRLITEEVGAQCKTSAQRIKADDKSDAQHVAKLQAEASQLKAQLAKAKAQLAKKSSQWVGAFNLTSGRKVPLSDGKPMMQGQGCLTQVGVIYLRQRRKNGMVSSPVTFIPCHNACCHCILPHCTLPRVRVWQTCTSCRKDLAFVMYFHRAKAGKCKPFTEGAPAVQCIALGKNEYGSAQSGQSKNLLCTKHTMARSVLRVSAMTPAVRRIFKQVEGKNGLAIPYWCPSHTHLTF
jgi:hypothetical protein